MIRILGIDPGSRVTGYGIIDVDRQRNLFVSCGCIQTGGGPLAERLRIIFRDIRDVVAEFMPDEMAVEQVFVHHNVESALKLGQARGAAICAGIDGSLPLAEYAPAAIKRAIVGTGRADKTQVQHMVRALLQLTQAPAADAADALAVAICHGHHSQANVRLKMGRNSA